MRGVPGVLHNPTDAGERYSDRLQLGTLCGGRVIDPTANRNSYVYMYLHSENTMGFAKTSHRNWIFWLI